MGKHKALNTQTMCSNDDGTIDKNIRLSSKGEPEDGEGNNSLALERRKAPRVSVQLPATATTDYGDSATGRITEVSRSGLRLEGDRSMLEILLPNFYRPNKHLPVSIQVSFLLAGKGQERQTVSIKCNIAFARRATLDVYHIGMQFVKIEKGGDCLADFLRSLGI